VSTVDQAKNLGQEMPAVMDAAAKGKTPIQLGPRQSLAEPCLLNASMTNVSMTNTTETKPAQVGT
jgi:hypothetical protein